MTKAEKQLQATEVRESLLRHCPRGARVFCVLRSCARSGMSRVIQLFVLDAGGDLVPIGHWAARLLGRRFDCERNGVLCRGSGMDMGFELVYSLSVALYSRSGDSAHFHEGAYSLRSEWL